MKQLFAFLGTVSPQPEAADKLDAQGEVLSDGLECALKKLLQSSGAAASWGMREDQPPLVIATYSYSQFRAIVWISHHDSEELETVFREHGPLSISVGGEGSNSLRTLCTLSPLPSKLPSCCLEIRWKKDEPDPRPVTSKLVRLCQDSGAVVSAPQTRITGAVVRFANPLAATEALARAKQVLTGKTSHVIRSIMLNEATVVACKWSSSGHAFIPSVKSKSSSEVRETMQQEICAPLHGD